MIDSLVEKVNKLILSEPIFDREGDVVYMFVELRKIIERDNIEKEFKIVKFYSDWIVHTRKDKVRDIKDILLEIKNNKLKDVEFALMERLKQELHILFKRYGILDFTEESTCWNDLLLQLTKILEDQPIEIEEKLEPGDVKSFCYVPIANTSKLIFWSLTYMDVEGNLQTMRCASGKIISDSLRRFEKVK